MMEYEQNVWNMIIKLYFDQLSNTWKKIMLRTKVIMFEKWLYCFGKNYTVSEKVAMFGVGSQCFHIVWNDVIIFRKL